LKLLFYLSLIICYFIVRNAITGNEKLNDALTSICNKLISKVKNQYTKYEQEVIVHSHDHPYIYGRRVRTAGARPFR
jgi:hypothetical protein